MSYDHFHELTPAQAESLALLLEELGEAQQAIGKILRHGIESRHPTTGVRNRDALEHELGDVRAAVQIACRIGLCEDSEIELYRREKLDKISQYLHSIDVTSDSATPRAWRAKP